MTEDVTGIRGVNRLAGAVLLQAIEDVRVGSGRRRVEALQWIMEDRTEEQFTFQFCCRMLHRDPVQVRRWATRITYEDWGGVVSGFGLDRAESLPDHSGALAAGA